MWQLLQDIRGKIFMNSIEKTFNNNKVLITFLTAGDPDIEHSYNFILKMAEAGADIIEIGIPFSDPIADGEIIGRANIRALKSETTIDKIFQMVINVRKQIDIPLIFLTYINPVFVYGYEKFFNNCKKCGINGLIIPDLPFEEKTEIADYAEKYSIDIITFIAPTSCKRVKSLAKNSTGFIYLISSLGVTGIRDKIITDLNSTITEIRKVTDTKIAIGFGISAIEQAREFSTIADGIIVGSAIVKIIEEFKENSDDKLYDYVKAMKIACSETN